METVTASVIDKIRSALRSEPRLDPHYDRIHIGFEDGVATLEREVTNVAVKKLALEHAAALREVTGILDRLHVKPPPWRRPRLASARVINDPRYESEGPTEILYPPLA